MVQARVAVCEQPSWPQVHMISVLSPMPSQWALQYLSLLFSGMQLQAGLAHFFVPAIITSEAGPARAREDPRAWEFEMRGNGDGMPG